MTVERTANAALSPRGAVRPSTDRRRILDLLVDGPRTTGELVAALAMDRHVVMAHLTILRAVDLVLTHKRGRNRVNFINAVPIEQIHHRWVTLVNSGGPADAKMDKVGTTWREILASLK